MGKNLRAPASRRFRPTVEALHDRVMPSVSLVGTTAVINGGAGNNVAVASLVPNGIQIVDNGQTTFLPRTAVQTIRYNGNGGNDYFRNDTDVPSQAFGLGGADTLVGGSAGDFIDGGDGADRLDGREGNDSFYAGNDLPVTRETPFGTIVFITHNYVDGGLGDDHIQGGFGNDTLLGSVGNDFISGTAGNDLIYGEPGNDTVSGGDGNDLIYGGPGNDRLNGNAGSDSVLGEDDNDSVSGDAGFDYVDGGNGDDNVFGNDDDDYCFGGRGSDYVSGGNGNDVLCGGVGYFDPVAGMAVDASSVSDDSPDVLWGNAGQDTFYVGDPRLFRPRLDDDRDVGSEDTAYAQSILPDFGRYDGVVRWGHLYGT